MVTSERSAGNPLLLTELAQAHKMVYMNEAIVAVINHQERFLFVQRGPTQSYAGYWTPVAGAVEPGESQENAVVREVYEEVGLLVHPLRKVWQCPTHNGKFILHWWLTSLTPGKIRVDGEEVTAVRWLSMDDIACLSPTFDDDVRFFREVFPGL